MSRIGRIPIQIPKGVKINIAGNLITVTGPKGSVDLLIDTPDILVEIEKERAVLKCLKEDSKSSAKHGLYRALLYNNIKGVTDGFEKNLQLVGVGYRAQKQGSKLVLQLGYSHPIEIEPPKGIEISVEGQNKIKVSGANKGLVGQVAHDIKYCRPVEPYKGKGVHYTGEYIRRKVGKAAKGAAA